MKLSSKQLGQAVNAAFFFSCDEQLNLCSFVTNFLIFKNVRTFDLVESIYMDTYVLKLRYIEVCQVKRHLISCRNFTNDMTSRERPL